MIRTSVILIVIAYVAGYAAIRVLNVETRDADNQAYVIFPERPIALYYFYRPLAHLDARLTGMRFHIGPHR